MYLNDLDRSHSPSSGRSCSTWKGAELMSLLRKATRGRRPGSLFLNPDAALDACRSDPAEKDHHSYSHRHREEDEDEWDKWSHRDFEREREGLELLLKKTEALQMSQMEQDRSRLLPVAEKLVELGAAIGARDNEGRTALHLAAGCGDKLMVLKLVELGADVNSRDSVGGTAMHHAAMANKKEMMFTLALLGCDWRAKADGIDGASPAFVLCGQHGKTTRQQKLLEAKLKRVYMGGEAARKSEKDCFEEAWAQATGQAEDYEERVERADANMAALLEEEAAEAAAAGNKRSSSKKRNKKSSERSLGTETAQRKGNQSSSVKKTESQITDQESASEGARNALKTALDEAVNCANFVLEIGTVAGRDAMMDVIEKMDHAIASAQHGSVSAKYAKKVRKKLQTLIEGLPEEPARTANGDKDGKDPSGGGSFKGTKDDDEGWITAQSGGRRKQSAPRFNAQHGDSGRRSASSGNCSGWLQAGQKYQKTSRACQQPSSKSNAPKQATSGICSPQQMEETQKMVLASIPKPSEKALIQNRIDAEQEVVQRSGSIVVVRAASADSNQGKSAKSVWEASQKTPSMTQTSALSDPDFPPLRSAMSTPSPYAPVLTRSGSRKTESDKHSMSQESVAMGPKQDTEAMMLPVQSSSSDSSVTVGQTESSVDMYPQYELFGASASPALSAALPTRLHSESASSIKLVSPYSPSDIYPSSLDTAGGTVTDFTDQAMENADGFYSVHQTETPPYAVHSSAAAMPILYMSGGYSPMSSYGPGMMPAAPSVFPVMSVHTGTNYDMMPQYAMYSCPPPARSIVYGSMHAGIPQYASPHLAESGPLHVAMQCTNSEEIADKLPKEIPGLVESDTEDTMVMHPMIHGHPSNGNPTETATVLPRHLLGELASELEA